MVCCKWLAVAVVGFFASSVILLTVSEAKTRCTSKSIVYDKCERRCKCRNGVPTKCARVRKEFMEMTIAERKRFINAYKRLASHPKYRKRYEKFVKVHKDYFFAGIHTARYFLPWHRWYILTFENMLREIDCRITIPYWDWAFWSKSAWDTKMSLWSSHEYGLGGDGDPKKQYCVQDGPFREGVFKTASFDNKAKVMNSMYYALARSKTSFYKATPNAGGCLRRSFNGHPIGLRRIRKILKNKVKSFVTFEFLVRVLLHNSIHNSIGGHMCSEYASLTPEFFLHHAFLDKLWYTWQKHSRYCLRVKFYKDEHSMATFKCKYTPRDLYNSNHLPNGVRVVYTDYYYEQGTHGTSKKSGYGKKISHYMNEDDLIDDQEDGVDSRDPDSDVRLVENNSEYDVDNDDNTDRNDDTEDVNDPINYQDDDRVNPRDPDSDVRLVENNSEYDVDNDDNTDRNDDTEDVNEHDPINYRDDRVNPRDPDHDLRLVENNNENDVDNDDNTGYNGDTEDVSPTEKWPPYKKVNIEKFLARVKKNKCYYY